MSVSAPFIRRPIATSLLAFAVMLGGWLGYWWLPVSSLPQVDFPTIQVTTQLPGAAPDTIAALVTAPLERQFGQIPSLSVMTSSSSFGISQVTLQFDLGRDIDGAAQDVQAAINAAGSTLPRGLPYPPTYAKVNPADAPVLTLALTSPTISLRNLSDLADTLMAQRLAEVGGVGRVSIQGGIRPAVRIQADLARLAGYGIGLEDIRQAIVGNNVSGPKGSLDGTHQSYTISANDQLVGVDSYKSMVVAYRNGAPVLLNDVADVVDGLENEKVGAWYQGTPAVVIDIQRQPGANVIETVERVRAELPRLQRAMPVGVTLTIVNDRTTTIRASIHDVQFTLLLSVVLVVLVVLMFLRTVRATIIAGVALPLSLIATFGVMWFCGFSLDNLSLMALTIGTGFVVDDAIVMIENVVRHIENGESPLDAALRGAREIGFTVISLTMSLIAVFIPLLFMTGLVGRMFREFALTLTIAVVVSAIVSLTLTPMMCSRILRPRAAKPGNRVGRFFNRAVDRTVEYYGQSLEWVLRRQRLTLLITLATLAATVGLYIIMPKGFLPSQDTGLIFAVSEAGPDGQRHQRQVVEREAAEPHHAEGGNQRQRQRHAGDDGGADGAQKDQHHQHHQHDAEHQGKLHVVDRRADGGGAVVDDGEIGAGRDGALQARQFGAQPLHGIDDIGAGLALHVDDDRRRAFVVGADLAVLQPLHHVGDVAEQHRRAVAKRHRDGFVGFRGVDLVVGGDGVGLVRAVERAFGAGDVAGHDHLAHVLQPDAVIGEPRQIDLDAHRRADVALHR
ncbi:MAG: multidrug efflux pump, partial [Alphaproteobacteria bacterium]|nr:multidrug efflux pump [Alphaproteobacteria bacterium]